MGFFKLHQPKKYGYRPIYYDPKKEAQKEREKRIAESEKGDLSNFKTSIHRGSFREQAGKSNARRFQTRQANIRLAIILFIILALLYYFLY